MSDCCALIINNSVVEWGPKTFKTFYAWQLEHEFKVVVKRLWKAVLIGGNGLKVLKDKFNGLKRDLK